MPVRPGARAGRGPRPAARHPPAPGQPPVPRWGPYGYSRAGVPAWHRTHARGGTVSTYPDHVLRMGSQHLAELKRKAAEFERQLWDAHESLEYEMDQSSFAPEGATDARQEAFNWSPDHE